MDDDNPSAYKPAPGDKGAKTKPSKYTKNIERCMVKNPEYPERKDNQSDKHSDLYTDENPKELFMVWVSKMLKLQEQVSVK